MYFPKWFARTSDIFIEYYKEYLEVKIDLICDPDNSEALERMKDVCEYFMEQGHPKQFNPHSSDNVIIQHEKSFEKMLVSMQDSGISTDDLSIFEFYYKVEYFENKYAKLKEHGSNKPL